MFCIIIFGEQPSVSKEIFRPPSFLMPTRHYLTYLSVSEPTADGLMFLDIHSSYEIVYVDITRCEENKMMKETKIMD